MYKNQSQYLYLISSDGISFTVEWEILELSSTLDLMTKRLGLILTENSYCSLVLPNIESIVLRLLLVLLHIIYDLKLKKAEFSLKETFFSQNPDLDSPASMLQKENHSSVSSDPIGEENFVPPIKKFLSDPGLTSLPDQNDSGLGQDIVIDLVTPTKFENTSHKRMKSPTRFLNFEEDQMSNSPSRSESLEHDFSHNIQLSPCIQHELFEDLKGYFTYLPIDYSRLLLAIDLLNLHWRKNSK